VIISCETESFLPVMKAMGEIFISMPKILLIEKYLVFSICSVCTAILIFFQGLSISCCFTYQNPCIDVKVKYKATRVTGKLRCFYFASTLALSQNL